MSSEIPPNHVEIVEGSAKMWYDEKEAVFYNKIQVLNRDLSIQTIKLFSEMITAERKDKYNTKKAKYDTNPSLFDKAPFEPVDGITVLDALAATGLRSVRYLKEIPKLRHIHINDLLPEATEVAMKNVRINGISDDQVTVHNGDATILMYQHRDPAKNFDVIDLDPYGTASPFLDSAVQAVAGDGGLLCVTCTDAPVLSGNYPEVCYAKYGSMSLKVKYYHEMALRILLNSIETAANKYKRYIVPWLSLSVDYYVRVFVRVYESPAEVKNTCLKRIMTYQSSQCGSFINQPIGTRNRTKKERMAESKKAADGAEASGESGGANGNYAAASHDVPAVCDETGGRWKVGGPFWGAPIHDQKITDILLARVDLAREINTSSNSASATDALPIPTAERLAGMLTSISEELKDVPFYYSLPDLAATLQCMVPTHLQFKAALVNAGYQVSHFHHDPNAFKTNAPNSVVWDIMRAHCKQHPPSGSKSKKLSEATLRILAKECKVVADFTVPPALLEPKKKIARFPPNPEANWGPKRRHGRVGDKTSSADADNVDDDAVGGAIEEDTPMHEAAKEVDATADQKLAAECVEPAAKRAKN